MGAGRVATAFAVFFSGLAVIVATVLVVYVFSYMADRLTCFNAAILTEEELEERRNASRVTIQSGLAGLLKDERNSIYRSFFEKGSFPYSKTPATSHDENDTSENDEQVDVEAQETVNPVEILSSEDVQGETDTVDKESMQNGAEATTYQSIDPCMAIDDEHSPTCSICLNEYDDGDKVILGTACSHMFHYDCCMQWVDKGNEHCPYCRENMISPADFLTTAIEIVGVERVAKLKRINESAAARVAELAATGTHVIQSPVPPVGHALDLATGPVVVATSGTLEANANSQSEQRGQGEALTNDSAINPVEISNQGPNVSENIEGTQE